MLLQDILRNKGSEVFSIDPESTLERAVHQGSTVAAEWRWIPADEVVDRIVPFKRAVYARVMAAFAATRDIPFVTFSTD